MPNLEEDVYSGNFPKARRLAFARSGGKCQFCGLRRAVEAHHWAYPLYPSGQNVQGHDLTALCKPCHELATTMRDWVARKHANFTDLAEELEACNTFIAKREAFSYWIYPEEEETRKYDSTTYNATSYKPEYKAAKRRRPSIGCIFWLIVVPTGLVMLTYLVNS